MAAKKEKSFEKLFRAMCSQNYEIGSRLYAKPTYVLNPHNFYIIPFPFIYDLVALSRPGSPLDTEHLRADRVVIFKSTNPDVNKYFKEDMDEHIRGVIQNVNDDNKCQIYALDRGFIEQDVPIARIFEPARKESLTTPSLVQQCELVSCSPIGPNFNFESIEAFKFYLGNEKLSVVIRGKSSNKLKVVVYNSNPDDIATLLALTQYTYLSCNIRLGWNAMTMDIPTLSNLAYQHIELKLDEVLNVRVQSGESLSSFYVTPISAYKKYLCDRADFTNFCKSLPRIVDKDFKPGMAVGIQDDASCFYERAIIMDVTETDLAIVKLVDWGTEVEVPRCRVKALKTEFFLSSPAYALFCSAVDGFIPWDNGLSNFLYKGYTFTIKVKQVGKGFEMPHVVALAQI